MILNSFQQADVIVNTTSQSLQLNQGGVSSSILTKGGTALQLECNKRYPYGIQFGDIAVTPQTGSLNCVEVYHGALPNWISEIHNKKVSHLNIYTRTKLIQFDTLPLKN